MQMWHCTRMHSQIRPCPHNSPTTPSNAFYVIGMAKYNCFFYNISQPSHTPYAMGGQKMAPRLVRFLPLRWPRRLGALAGAEGRPDAAILPAGVQLLQHHAETGQDQGMVGPWTRWSCLLVMVMQSLYTIQL